MYYFVKALEATGLGIIAIGFVSSFPQLLNTKVWTCGAAIFAVGWGLEHFLLRK